MAYLDELNQEQREAVTWTEGPLLVLAGAGSGKTRVITYRILHLIHKKHVPPLHILGVTFTNKAADEMKERIRRLALKNPRGLLLCTFHSLGVRILKENIHLLGYKNNFNIYDEDDRRNLIKSVLSELHVDSLDFNLNHMAKHISLAKNMNLFQRYFDALEDEEYRILLKNVFKRYEELLKNYNAVDFDDLILLPVRILSKFKDVQERFHRKFRYILVDEYQDTNNIQYQFIKKLLNPGNNICVVGDDDQAIYGFRGSRIEHILWFEKDFPDTKVVTLTKNYRSTRNILSAAGEVIRNNKTRHAKSLEATHGAGEKIIIKETADETKEAEFVVQKIFDLHHHQNIAWKEMAVLYRTNFQSRAFEEQLRLKNIPYEIVGGMGFYDRKEIKDILAYLKVIANEKDELSLLRVINYPRRGLGDRTVYELNQYSMKTSLSLFKTLMEVQRINDVKGAAKETIMGFVQLIHRYKREFTGSKKPLYRIAHDLIKEIRLEDELMEEFHDDLSQVKRKMYNISELISSIRNYEEQAREEHERPDLYHYLSKISLFTKEEEEVDEIRNNKVLLMTLHLSKGLEFRSVFLVGVENDLLPHLKTMEEGGSLEEERRLLYVGMTRAREILVLTYAMNRKKFGLPVEKGPSPFLQEIPGLYLKPGDEVPDRKKEIEKSRETILRIKEMLAQGKKASE